MREFRNMPPIIIIVCESFIFGLCDFFGFILLLFFLAALL